MQTYQHCLARLEPFPWQLQNEFYLPLILIWSHYKVTVRAVSTQGEISNIRNQSKTCIRSKSQVSLTMTFVSDRAIHTIRGTRTNQVKKKLKGSSSCIQQFVISVIIACINVTNSKVIVYGSKGRFLNTVN